MRSLRSFFATTSSAPSSIFLRPIFQLSATRIEYCSMVSGWVVRTMRTAIWLPLRRWKSSSRRDCADMSSPESVLVRSMTRAVAGGVGGTATSANAACVQHRNSASSKAFAREIDVTTDGTISGSRLFLRRRLRRPQVEIDLGRARDFLLVLDLEIRLRLVAERHGGEIGREAADGDVVVLHRFDVAVARDRDAVLGALELRHQIAKQCVRFELRIILGHDHQPLQRASKLALRLGEFLESGGIIQQLRCRLDAADLGAGLGDADQYGLLLLRKTLHRIDKVRHQIGAALIL